MKTDVLQSDSRVLYSGRFYILEYRAKTKERFNQRPVMLSLGISKKDPDSFLCVDLSVLPKKIRLQFLDIYFRVYQDEIMKNIDKYMFVEDADKQGWMRTFTYDNLCKMMRIPIKNAVKRYKIENTIRIYSIPFNRVFKFVGDYCDQNFYMNGNIGEVQMEFLKKMR